MKIFMYYRVSDQTALREAMGTKHGKSWSRGGGEHPPAIEMHISNRYFAVTADQLHDTSNMIETIPIETLLWLIGGAGPAFKGKREHVKAGNPWVDAVQSDDDVLTRLDRAAMADPHLRLTLGRLESYSSRSEAAMSLGSAVKAMGWSREDMIAALQQHPATAAWTAEKGEAAGQRELDRIWMRAELPTHEAVEWPEPDMSILRTGRRPPPEFPLDLLGPKWSEWISNAAEAAASPVDYVAGTLLCVASGLVGNARWAQATPGWREPPHLWVACVGDSGTNKSGGADCLMRDVLPEIEKRMIGDFPDRQKEWRLQSEEYKAAEEAWQQDVRSAFKERRTPPLPPAGGEPLKPETPRLCQSDVTVERVASLLARAAPKGLLIMRDELAGWLRGLTAYNDAGRAFWIEAYGGRPYRVERQKHPEPIIVPRLAVSVSGGTQPEKLAEMFKDADDGLLARFVWCWPNPRPFQLSCTTPGTEWATEALDQLRMLSLALNGNGEVEPVNMPLSDTAIALMERFGQDMQAAQQDAGGLMRSAYGKARGLALRLSLIIAMLHWCGQHPDAPQHNVISDEDLTAACRLVGEYFMPMAARVYGDAAATRAERNASTLARWIMKTKPHEVHVRSLQREVRLPGLNTADAIHAAAEVLAEAGWLQHPVKGSFRAKPKGVYPVNPAIVKDVP